MAERDPPSNGELAVAGWFAAFNDRDLEAMLGWMHPDVEFQPLWLAGLRCTYRGHDDIRCWFDEFRRQHHRHRVHLTELASNPGQTLVIGTLHPNHGADPAPFCAIHSLAHGLIVAAHHHMSDPESLLQIEPAPTARALTVTPPRNPPDTPVTVATSATPTTHPG